MTVYSAKTHVLRSSPTALTTPKSYSETKSSSFTTTWMKELRTQSEPSKTVLILSPSQITHLSEYLPPHVQVHCSGSISPSTVKAEPNSPTKPSKSSQGSSLQRKKGL